MRYFHIAAGLFHYGLFSSIKIFYPPNFKMFVLSSAMHQVSIFIYNRSPDSVAKDIQMSYASTILTWITSMHEFIFLKKLSKMFLFVVLNSFLFRICFIDYFTSFVLIFEFLYMMWLRNYRTKLQRSYNYNFYILSQFMGYIWLCQLKQFHTHEKQ